MHFSGSEQNKQPYKIIQTNNTIQKYCSLCQIMGFTISTLCNTCVVLFSFLYLLARFNLFYK